MSDLDRYVKDLSNMFLFNIVCRIFSVLGLGLAENTCNLWGNILYGVSSNSVAKVEK